MPFQKEWDIASYQRKFSGTIAFCSRGEAPPRWRYIQYIKDSHLVYEVGNGDAIGQVCTECNCSPTTEKLYHDPNVFPVIQFQYAPIYPGAYFDMNGKDVWYLKKRHLKSYKVGLSDETYLVRSSLHGEYGRISQRIDLTNPVKSYYQVKNIEVFSPKLVRIDYDLFADGANIGFLDKGVAILRHEKFKPFIRHLLEDKWQIVSL